MCKVFSHIKHALVLYISYKRLQPSKNFLTFRKLQIGVTEVKWECCAYQVCHVQDLIAQQFRNFWASLKQSETLRALGLTVWSVALIFGTILIQMYSDISHCFTFHCFQIWLLWRIIAYIAKSMKLDGSSLLSGVETLFNEKLN